MRDPKRIDRIQAKFTKIWKTNPDLRKGQLFFNLTGQYDCFYVKDETLEDALDEEIELMKEKGRKKNG